MNTEFPKFWYESNACWGMVKSVQDLVEKARLQLAENNDITTIDLFLDKSVKSGWDGMLSFGTRREHTENYSLRNLLVENGVLDDFLFNFNTAKNEQQ